jgi:hypothetical protein
MSSNAKPSNATTNNKKTKRIPAMPRFTLAEVLKDLAIAEADYESEPTDPLAASWTHMEQSRGWK